MSSTRIISYGNLGDGVVVVLWLCFWDYGASLIVIDFCFGMGICFWCLVFGDWFLVRA